MRRKNNAAAIIAVALTLGAAANAGQANSEKLKFSVKTDKKMYAINAPVKMTFTVKNTSLQPIALTFISGKRYEISILQGEKPLWNSSRGRMFTQEISTETLASGKSLTYTETFRPGTAAMPALLPGTYTVSAFPATTDKVVLRITTTFKIIAAK